MPHSTSPFRPANALIWHNVVPGIRRTLVAYTDDLQLVKVEFETHAVSLIHQHAHGHISYIESGEFAVTVGEETRILHAGDSFYAAPNVPHGVVARQAGTLLDSVGPAHEDFLPPAK